MWSFVQKIFWPLCVLLSQLRARILNKKHSTLYRWNISPGHLSFFFFFGTALSRFLYHFILCWTAGLLYPSYSHNRLVNTNFLKEKASSLLIKCLDYTVGTGLTILEIRVLSKVPCPSTFVQCQWKKSLIRKYIAEVWKIRRGLNLKILVC